jgi:trehalose 6-phosphate synthase/phosphatase
VLTEVMCLVQVMLGVDRLDMIKGIPQKLLAFEKFLEENPDWINKVSRPALSSNGFLVPVI